MGFCGQAPLCCHLLNYNLLTAVLQSLFVLVNIGISVVLHCLSKCVSAPFMAVKSCLKAQMQLCWISCSLGVCLGGKPGSHCVTRDTLPLSTLN